MVRVSAAWWSSDGGVSPLQFTAEKNMMDAERRKLVVESNKGTKFKTYPDSKVHGANMGPTWVLSAPDGPHDGPMNLAIRVQIQCRFQNWMRLFYYIEIKAVIDVYFLFETGKKSLCVHKLFSYFSIFIAYITTAICFFEMIDQIPMVLLYTGYKIYYEFLLIIVLSVLFQRWAVVGEWPDPSDQRSGRERLASGGHRPIAAGGGVRDSGGGSRYCRAAIGTRHRAPQQLTAATSRHGGEYASYLFLLTLHMWNFDSSPPGQNGRRFADDIFRWIFVNEKFCILISPMLTQFTDAYMQH